MRGETCSDTQNKEGPEGYSAPRRPIARSDSVNNQNTIPGFSCYWLTNQYTLLTLPDARCTKASRRPSVAAWITTFHSAALPGLTLISMSLKMSRKMENIVFLSNGYFNHLMPEEIHNTVPQRSPRPLKCWMCGKEATASTEALPVHSTPSEELRRHQSNWACPLGADSLARDWFKFIPI